MTQTQSRIRLENYETIENWNEFKIFNESTSNLG